MKTFTLIPKHKWVMTTALLAVLGFNVSFNSHQAGIASADFASTSGDLVESKLVTVDGVMPVKYVNNGESEVLAIVPKKLTEGKVCDNCGYETIPLTTKNKSDIDALNVQLLKALQKAKPKTEVAREEDAVEVAEEDVPEKKDPFESIEKACRRHKSNSDVLTCTTDKFIAILKKKKGPEIDKLDALDFYKEKIESAIRFEISEARRLANRARRASVTPSQSQNLMNSDDWASEPGDILQNAAEMREGALKVIRTILAGTPSKYEEIRKRLLSAETEIARDEARELQQTFIQARDSKDPSQGVYLFKEGELRRVDLQDLIRSMQYHSNAGLAKARSGNDLNSELQAHYETYMNNFFEKMNEGMWTNPYGFMGGGGNTTTLPGVDLAGRMANPSRKIIIPVQNNGVGFGTLIPASPESLRMRAENRQRQ